MNFSKIIRIFLGIMFLMTGMMKLFLPFFGNAFLIQLTEAGIPMVELNFWIIPIIEVILGFMLLFNYQAKLTMIIIIPIMLVATYVHIVVVNPAAFPAQPQFPIMPLMVLMMIGAYFFLQKRREVTGEVIH